MGSDDEAAEIIPGDAIETVSGEVVGTIETVAVKSSMNLQEPQHREHLQLLSPLSITVSPTMILEQALRKKSSGQTWMRSAP